jgi:hypothetical protein
MLTEDEQYLVQSTNVNSFLKFMHVVSKAYPDLKFRELRNKTLKLWRARKEWLEKLEPTRPSLDKEGPRVIVDLSMRYPPLPPSPVNEL